MVKKNDIRQVALLQPARRDGLDQLGERKSASDSGKWAQPEMRLNPDAASEAEEPETPSLLIEAEEDSDIVELEEQGGSPPAIC